MKKKDLVLIGIILLVAVVGLIVVGQLKKGDAQTATVIIEGKPYKTIQLSEDQEFTVSNKYGENHIVVKDGYVYMEYADCPDQYCVNHKRISRPGDPIICLPHKLVVEIGEE